MVTATRVRLTDSATLGLTWNDGHDSLIPLAAVRDSCPCAGCQGESVLLRTYTPEPQPMLPGRYELTGAQPVGNYALQLTWGDGHATGIYTWDTLRSLCPCPECTTARAR